MVIDFQHHYVPVELAKRRGLYSETTTYLEEDGRRATTLHERLYDLDLQLRVRGVRESERLGPEHRRLAGERSQRDVLLHAG